MMKKQKYMARVLIKGGFLSPGYMLKITSVARKLGNEHIHFGSKQDILFEIRREDIGLVVSELYKYDVKIILNEDKRNKEQNIITSYVAYDILPSTTWVTGGTYISILDDFNYTPKLRVSITDPAQNLVPLFAGNLNFVASEKENYWHLYLKLPFLHIRLKWPGLIYSKDIPGLSFDFEDIYFNQPDITADEIIEKLRAKGNYYFNKVENEVELPKGFFPYYEGINSMLKGNNHWAGFYWRNNNYDIRFVEAISKLCIKTNLSRICITPWKSFLIKDIKNPDLIKWQQIIGQFGINMRHSSFELNWHLPLLNESCYKLKTFITNEFNKIDIRTYGITFSVAESIENQFTTIVIVKKPLFKGLDNMLVMNKFDIYYAKDFNPNLHEYVLHSSFVSKSDLVEKLVELCREFYIKLDVPKVKIKKEEHESNHQKIKYRLFQCPDCLTIYDEEKGDEYRNIKPRTLFIELPDSYLCPTCDNPKTAFVNYVAGDYDMAIAKN